MWPRTKCYTTVYNGQTWHLFVRHILIFQGSSFHFTLFTFISFLYTLRKLCCLSVGMGFSEVWFVLFNFWIKLIFFRKMSVFVWYPNPLQRRKRASFKVIRRFIIGLIVSLLVLAYVLLTLRENWLDFVDFWTYMLRFA